MLTFALISSLFIHFSPTAIAESNVRPPQFVLIAFDNCQENQTWKSVSEFLSELNEANPNNLRFTFFLSGVALLSDAKKNQYKNPSHLLKEDYEEERKPWTSKFPERARALRDGKKFENFGQSNIGWGGERTDLIQRSKYINQLFLAGNEIASHAVGHFKGGKWTNEMWEHEFLQFQNLVEGFQRVNGLETQHSLAFGMKDIVGFRAPYLDGRASLQDTLKKFRFLYDASDPNLGIDPRNWPRRHSQGHWNFSLGSIYVPGLVGARDRKPFKIHAMDYTFCINQHLGCPEKYPETMVNAERDADAMLQAYLDYFVQNYNGNRAPVHIGHHFYPYRGGVYNRSLFRLIRTVCALPEVRCSTHRQLAEYLNTLSKEDLQAFQGGKFKQSEFKPSLEWLLQEARKK